MVAADRAEVLPVPVEQVGAHGLRLVVPREHLLAEVGRQRLGREQLVQHLRLEQVDAHVGEVVPAVARDPAALDPVGGRVVRLALLGRLRLLHEPGDAALRVHAQQPEPGGVPLGHRDGGDGHVGPEAAVRLDELAEVHAVQLVAGQDEHLVRVLALDVRQVLAHRVGRALVPVGALVRLLRGQHLDEPLAEHVELVRVGDVPVQADAEELREHVDVVHLAVDAVGDGQVDEPVLAGDGDRRLGPRLGEREQPGAATASQNECENGAHGVGLGADQKRNGPGATGEPAG